MSTLPFIDAFIKATNNLLDFIFLWGGLFLILQYPFRFFAKGMDKYDKEKLKNPNENKGWELLSQTFILFLATVVAGIFWVMPELVIYKWPQLLELMPLARATWFRWGLICLAVTFFAYIYGHENGEGRWIKSCLGHAGLIFFGLVLDGWMGLLFISVPVLAAYYFYLYHLAIVTLPTANPDDPNERWKRFIVFASYTWGIQFPLVVADDNSWKKPEIRIHGDFTWDYPVPGMIWMKSHQVAGITAGIKFKRVEGPGLIFTGSMERAEQIFDLRLQLRSNAVDVVTKDGISLKVIIFTAFRIDNEDWTEETYKNLRSMNPLLRGAKIPSYKNGSFHYSPLRIQTTLGITSGKAGQQDSPIFWDQWAVNVVEDQTRKVIAQKKLDELWRLSKEQDTKFANALDVIANEIKAGVAPILRASGILVYVARVVNFSFPTEKDQHEITQQQINTWGSEWEGKRSNIMAEAQVEAESAQQKARAYAASLMLNSIAEGLQLTGAIDPNLPRHMVGMLFLSSLKGYIEQQPIIEQTLENEQEENDHHYVRELREKLHHQEKKS